MKKFELASKLKIKSFEKNPQKGGTPAIEKRLTTKTFAKKLVFPKLFSEDIEAVRELIN